MGYFLALSLIVSSMSTKIAYHWNVGRLKPFHICSSVEFCEAKAKASAFSCRTASFLFAHRCCRHFRGRRNGGNTRFRCSRRKTNIFGVCRLSKCSAGGVRLCQTSMGACLLPRGSRQNVVVIGNSKLVQVNFE